MTNFAVKGRFSDLARLGSFDAAVDETEADSEVPFLPAKCRADAAKGRSESERRRSAAGFASPPTKSHSSPILTFDDTLFLDMSFQTLPSEDWTTM